MSISKEIFGIDKETTNDCSMSFRDYVDGFNDCLNVIDSFELNEEELANIISNEWYDQLGKGLNRGQACKLFAKAIKSNQSKIFVRKNETK